MCRHRQQKQKRTEFPQYAKQKNNDMDTGIHVLILQEKVGPLNIYVPK